MLPLAFLTAMQSAPVLLNVDATEAARGIFHVRETFPAGGNLVLKYPKWIPGEHGPSGPVFDVVDIFFTQNGHQLEWHHDPLDLFTIKVQASRGPVEMSFNYVAPRHNVATRNLARIKWNRLIFLPPSNAATMIQPFLFAPIGWSFATPLDFEGIGKLETVTAERLIDSPGVIGRYYHRDRIDTLPGQPPAALDVFTEKPATLNSSTIEGHKRLYREALSFYGAAHFRHYQFLLTFSDEGAGEGLEHNECSEDGLGFDALKNDVAISDLDAHEFSHSWCGKYRRPIGLGNLNYDAQMDDRDLWVYEGFTQFAGVVLSARSGMWTPEQFRDRIAADIDEEQTRSGRGWRTVEDTAIFGSLINTFPDAWGSRRRYSDYYTEMVSVWLEADGIIRRESSGKRSIDDFCHAFFGGRNAGPQIVPYTREQLYATLNSVQPYDWKRFFQTRVLSIRPTLDDGWLAKTGWIMAMDSQPNAFNTAIQIGERKFAWMLGSLGIGVSEGEIRDVQGNSAADTAKLAPGMKLISVDGAKYSVAALEEAVAKHASDRSPVELVVDDYNVIRTIKVDYHGGLRIPHLKRAEGTPDFLAPVGRPHAG